MTQRELQLCVSDPDAWGPEWKGSDFALADMPVSDRQPDSWCWGWASSPVPSRALALGFGEDSGADGGSAWATHGREFEAWYSSGKASDSQAGGGKAAGGGNAGGGKAWDSHAGGSKAAGGGNAWDSHAGGGNAWDSHAGGGTAAGGGKAWDSQAGGSDDDDMPSLTWESRGWKDDGQSEIWDQDDLTAIEQDLLKLFKGEADDDDDDEGVVMK